MAWSIQDIGSWGAATTTSPATEMAAAVALPGSWGWYPNGNTLLVRRDQWATVLTPPGPPVAGYSAWWDASQIAGVADGAALATWPDKSGHGYDLTQATGANQPTFYKTTSAQLLNGLPTVRFAASKWVQATAVGLMRAVPFTIACVYVVDSFPGSICNLVSSNANSTVLYLFTSGTQVGMHGNGDQFIHTTNTSPHVVSAVYNGASSIAQYDAIPVTISSSNVMDSPLSSYVSVGGDPGGGSIVGRIGEVVVYPSALSAAQLVTVNAYLKTKWGTA